MSRGEIIINYLLFVFLCISAGICDVIYKKYKKVRNENFHLRYALKKLQTKKAEEFFAAAEDPEIWKMENGSKYKMIKKYDEILEKEQTLSDLDWVKYETFKEMIKEFNKLIAANFLNSITFATNEETAADKTPKQIKKLKKAMNHAFERIKIEISIQKAE